MHPRHPARRLPFRPALGAAAVLALALAAAPARAEVPRVVADIAPVQGLAAMVMGELGQPELLVGAGADAHDFQLRPSQRRALAGADLVVWTGPGFAPWLAAVLGNEEAVSLPLLEPGQGGGDGHDRGRAQDDDHDHPSGATGGHDHGHAEAHAWLDPATAALWVDRIAAELARLDPGHAAVYAANAAAARARIAAAEARAAALLAAVRGRPFIVQHDAYGAFAEHFGLTVAGSIADAGAAAPGAARLRALRGAGAGGAVCVFPEANHDPALAADLARDAGLRLGPPLDPEGSALPPGPDLYPALLAGLAAAIAACLAP